MPTVLRVPFKWLQQGETRLDGSFLPIERELS